MSWQLNSSFPISSSMSSRGKLRKKGAGRANSHANPSLHLRSSKNPASLLARALRKVSSLAKCKRISLLFKSNESLLATVRLLPLCTPATLHSIANQARLHKSLQQCLPLKTAELLSLLECTKFWEAVATGISINQISPGS